MELSDIANKATKAYDSAASAHKRLDTIETDVKQNHDIAKAAKQEIENMVESVHEIRDEVKDTHDLAVAMSAMNEKVKNISNNMDEIKKEIKKVTERPAGWWDKMIAAIIGAIASGLVASLLTLILK